APTRTPHIDRRTGDHTGARAHRVRGLGRGTQRWRAGHHQRADGQQPADDRPATADEGELHRRHGHLRQLHRAARERRPGQDQPGVLQPGGPVRRGDAEQFRDPHLRPQRVGGPAGRVRGGRLRVRPGRHPRPADRVAVRRRRQALRRAVLRRVVVPDVPPGHPGGRRRGDAGGPDLAGGRGHRGAGRRRRAGDGRHLPARPARLGPGVRAPHHGGQHLRGHLVHRGLGSPGEQPGVPRGGRLLRRPGPGVRRDRRPPGGLHRVPEQRDPGQRGDVVRRDLGRGIARGRGLTGARPDGLRRRTRGGDRQLRLAVRLVVEHPAGEREEGRRVGVHLLGLRPGVRGTGRRGARLVEGARRKAGVDLLEPRLPRRGRGVRRAHPRGHRERRPERSGRPAPPGAGHPVHRHPGVPRPGHAGLPGRQLRDRRPDDRGGSARPGPGTGRGRRRTLSGTGVRM
ncbi:MAG: Various polyols ABC transporter, substrate-binding protein, partial [uncultured Blastococcus sp.]